MSNGIFLTDLPARRSHGQGNPLLRKIQRACRMSLPEPDLALNLDVADYINEKQGAASRDAVLAIARLVNNADTHTAVFALSLLDVLVKNCGYPIHLQISRKEFLNELVKRFPEHPPLRYSKVHRLILTAIEEWYQTICKHAPYKDDLGYIRDMHRLLKYKGYVFPKIHEEDLAVLKPSDQLRTPSEIQKEQEIQQAAKLEELIRRGKPEDLREANKLMKIMAGFKEDNAVQAKQVIVNELNKLKRKADLLNEMMSTSDNPDLSNETVDELYGALKGAQPKFQKIIEEEHEDDTLIQGLLKFNDTVNQILEKYSLFKMGNSAAASSIKPDVLSQKPQVSGGALANEINLIDFDEDDIKVDLTDKNNTDTDDAKDLLGDFNDLKISEVDNNGTTNGAGEIFLGGSDSPNPAYASSDNNNSDLLAELTLSNTLSSVNSKRLLVSDSSNLMINFEVQRENDSRLHLKTFISNKTTSLLNDFVILLAVPKSMSLKLNAQSASNLGPLARDGITQEAWIDGARLNSGKPLKIKWKVDYKMNSNMVEDTGLFTLPNL